ncbi:hypothetical protein PanWU01x14_016040 [Parasponia andersonii]|uniref:Uncharacterized protein n=1 Tax=Parasponia andersonii TaxID=3476 RepID=A0A2P5E0N8_PARAD|nr:hypothetical protein PanWU01x14_016040 [Parasponia andersonii]
MSKKRHTTYVAFKEKAYEIENAKRYFITRVKEGTITPMVDTSGETGKRVKVEGRTSGPYPKKSKQNASPPSNSLQHLSMNNLRPTLPSLNKVIAPKQNYIPLNMTREEI